MSPSFNTFVEQNLVAARSYAVAAERYSMGTAEHQAFVATMRERG